MNVSSILLTVRLKMSGLWRDAWLYKEKIYAWDRQGSLYYASMESIHQHIAKLYGPHAALVAQHLIFRNDWKNGKNFRSMAAIPEIEASFLRPFDNSPSGTLEFDVPAELFTESSSESYEGTVLDTYMFANRVYLGTSEGLLESYIHPRRPDRGYPLERQLDHRVNDLAIRYAAINASAEDAGLYFCPIEFRTNSLDRDEWTGFGKPRFRRIADVSYLVAHVGRDILNYTDSAAPTYLKAHVETATHESARYDDYNVVGYESPKDLLSAAEAAMRSNLSSAREAVAVLGNSGVFLLAATGPSLRVVSLRTHASSEPSMQTSKQFHRDVSWFTSAEDILRTYSINSGFVIETEDCIRLMTKMGSYKLLDGEAARVRTYRASLRHKEVVSIVQEKSLSILGFYEKMATLF